MNQTTYNILKFLAENGKTSAVNAMTIRELLEVDTIKVASNTIYKQIRKLKEEGMIKDGLRAGKENTYFITAIGVQTKKELEGN